MATANVGPHLDKTMSQLPLTWMWKPNISTGVGFTDRAVWSRASRRHASKGQSTDEDEDENMALGFKIQMGVGEQDTTKVTVRWLKGHDSVLFESFCGMIKRKLEAAK